MQVQNLKEFGLPTLDAAPDSKKNTPNPMPAESATPIDGDDQATKEAADNNQASKTTANATTNDNEGGNLSNNDSEDSGEIVEDTHEPQTPSTSNVRDKPAEASSNADNKATVNLSTRRAGYGEPVFSTTQSVS